MPDYNLVKPALTNVSKRYTSPGYSIEQILPRVPVSKTSAKYYVFDKENLRIDETIRASKTASNETTYTVSTGTYTLIKHALHGYVDEEDRMNAQGTSLDPDADMTELVTEKLLNRMEYDGTQLVFDSGDYASGNKAAVTGTNRWDISTIADPIAAVNSASDTVLQKIGKRPNTMVIGVQVLKALRTNDAIQDVIKYTQFGIPTEELLARAFMVDKVVVASGVYNSAVEGQTDSLLFLWGKKAALIYVPTRPALKEPAFGYIFSRPQGRVVRSWEDNDLNATAIEVEDQYDIKSVDTSAGFLFDGVVS